MAAINKALVMGHLGQDPELRYTNTQMAVTTLSVATTEYRAGRDGAPRQEFTEWHRIVVWGKQAENCHKYLKKGSAVFVEGRIQTRSWDDKNGQKRYSTEIIASNVQFMSPPSQGSYSNGARQESSPFGTSSYDQQGSFSAEGNQAPYESSFQDFPQATPASSGYAPAGAGHADLDDIPFMRLNEYGL